MLMELWQLEEKDGAVQAVLGVCEMHVCVRTQCCDSAYRLIRIRGFVGRCDVGMDGVWKQRVWQVGGRYISPYRPPLPDPWGRIRHSDTSAPAVIV